jgi:hypothetical protein
MFALVATVGTVGTVSTSPGFAEKKYRRVIVGTLIEEGVHNWAFVTESSLNNLAAFLKEEFRAAFDEVWSFVVFTDESDFQERMHGWWHCTLGDHRYTVAGEKYLGGSDTSSWASKYTDYFTSEFACQQWVPECKPVANSLQLKYDEKFGGRQGVVVVRGGVAGSSIIGSFHSHCGHKVWIMRQ